ncbi:MAG: selenide, water dikinase SelD [Candidatus Marinimicrobia bacterium]|nr:selenide, water dikinase SelD [Candidatus Neomarinimicrobiota bacterium]
MGTLKSKKDERVLVGYDDKDDAAVVRLSDGRLLVQTVDFFTPIDDDPYTFGQIAAANSLSDIYAMGATPLFALNIIGFPINVLPKSDLSKILQGGIDKAEEAGISIVGGHSIDDPEPKYGLVVTGEVVEENLITNSNAQPGDKLILTKPLGTGIIATAVKRGIANKIAAAKSAESMATLNKFAAEVMTEIGVNAATDVTGFGLLGHLSEMCEASGVSAKIDYQALPFLPSVKELAENGIVPGGTKRNLKFVQDKVQFGEHLTDIDKLLLADAQTSGGLLISLPAEKVEKYISKFNELSEIKAVVIGEIIKKSNLRIYLT